MSKAFNRREYIRQRSRTSIIGMVFSWEMLLNTIPPPLVELPTSSCYKYNKKGRAVQNESYPIGNSYNNIEAKQNRGAYDETRMDVR